MFFKHIEAAPADPILGLGEAFKAETRPEKVNLGIGVYKDASGATPIVKAVKEAEKRLLEPSTALPITTSKPKSCCLAKTTKSLPAVAPKQRKASAAQAHCVLRPNLSNAS